MVDGSARVMNGDSAAIPLHKLQNIVWVPRYTHGPKGLTNLSDIWLAFNVSEGPDDTQQQSCSQLATMTDVSIEGKVPPSNKSYKARGIIIAKVKGQSPMTVECELDVDPLFFSAANLSVTRDSGAPVVHGLMCGRILASEDDERYLQFFLSDEEQGPSN